MTTSNRTGTLNIATDAGRLDGRRLRSLNRGIAGALVVVAATFALNVSAQPSAAAAPADGMRPPAAVPGTTPPPPPPPHGDWQRGGPRGEARGGPGGPGMMMDGRMVERMLRSVNATDAQRTQVKAIVDAARTDLRNMRGQTRGEREQAMAIFTAPTIDATAAEALRRQSLADHDQASKRMLTAMLDVARVLTPEQRAQLGERMKQRGENMRERMDAHRSAPPASAASGPRP